MNILDRPWARYALAAVIDPAGRMNTLVRYPAIYGTQAVHTLCADLILIVGLLLMRLRLFPRGALPC